jgi:hypothetical protein
MAKQFNVWLENELKDSLVALAQSEGRPIKELAQSILRAGIERQQAKVVEQQALPLIRKAIRAEVRAATAQLRSDLYGDIKSYINQFKDSTRRSDN